MWCEETVVLYISDLNKNIDIFKCNKTESIDWLYQSFMAH